MKLTNSIGQSRIIPPFLIISTLYFLNLNFEHVTNNAKKLTVHGAIKNVDSYQSISVAKHQPLPLVTGIVKNSHLADNSSLNDSIFFTPKIKKSTKDLTKIKPRKKNKKTIDLQASLEDSLTLNSISRNGAIINGTFFNKGEELSLVKIPMVDGTSISPKLIGINSNLDSLTFALNERDITISISNNNKG